MQENDGENSEEDDELAEEMKNREFKKKQNKKTKEQIDKEALLLENYYDLLGLGEDGMGASEQQIAKAYRKKALKHHPDKLGDKLTEKDKEIWNKLQKAYDTLVDPQKKKVYDSSLPFDESVPKMEDITSDAEFFTQFRRCFKRNAKFSVNKPAPDLGDEKTDIKEVYKFYKFW